MIRISSGSRCAAILALLGLSGGLTVFGCSAPDSTKPAETSENTGSIGLLLQAGGVTLNSVSFTIVGPGNYSKAGSIDVSHSSAISALIGGIPAGNGYSVSLTAADAGDAGITCAGSASFNVTAGATTAAQVHLTCKVPPRTGSVLLNGSLNICPVIDSLSADPNETTVGHSVALSAAAHDADLAPSALSYNWTTTGGTLTGATTANPALLCTAPGPVTVQLVVGDGDCSDTLSQLITCSPASTGSGGAAGTSGAAGSGTAGATSGAGGTGGTGGSSGSSGSGGDAGAASGSGGTGGSLAGSGGAGLGGSSGSAGSSGSTGGGGLIKINEIESSGGIPDDWVELYNAGSAPIDISGYVFRDNDDTHFYAIAANTIVAPGAYFVLDTVTASTPGGFNFGLGSTDAARLYLPDGVTIVDSYNWVGHATTTYGRCPNGTGAFTTTASSTKGAANDCGSSGGSGGSSGTGGSGGGGAGGSGGTAGSGGTGGVSAFDVWPGGNSVVTLDVANTWTSNLSGVFYEPPQGSSPAVLWAVQNGPSKFFRLIDNGTNWVSDPDNGWSAGKTETYTTGLGGPDSEGITKAAFGSTGVYVSTERDNTANTVSRLSVLLYDTSTVATTLSATRDWNLTADLPTAGANLGLEAITWVPDAYLVAKGFIDESTNHLYDPSIYANHAGGIFFVGLEQNGMIYGYALDHVGGGFTRVATIASGNPSIMDLSFDRDVGYLWAACDDTCQGRTNVLDIDTRVGSPTLGKFYIRKGFERPSSMGNFNNEGFTVTPESSCVAGFKPVFYADDNNDNSHSLRRDSIPCGAFL